MDFRDYVHQAALTDRFPDETQAIQVALLGIAGEAGEVVSEAKKSLRSEVPLSSIQDRVNEEVGDLLWYIALLVRRLGLDLNLIAEQNLSKTKQIWVDNLPPPSQYDDHPYEAERLPRKFIVDFVEDQSTSPPRAYMVAHGELGERVSEVRRRKGKEELTHGQLGDPLDDNTIGDDGYRFHDIIHLSHAAVLGWSPVLRALIGAKRKSVDDYDRVQDGARAIAIEEALAAFVYGYFEDNDFAPLSFDWTLYKHMHRATRGLEVADQPFVAWRTTYAQAFDILSQLQAAGGGTVECDLDARQLKLRG